MVYVKLYYGKKFVDNTFANLQPMRYKSSVKPLKVPLSLTPMYYKRDYSVNHILTMHYTHKGNNNVTDALKCALLAYFKTNVKKGQLLRKSFLFDIITTDKNGNVTTISGNDIKGIRVRSNGKKLNNASFKHIRERIECAMSNKHNTIDKINF